MNILDSFKLNGKVVVITGAAGQVADQLSIAYTQAGANVVLTDIKSQVDKCKERAEKLEGDNLALELDITNKESVQNCLKKVVEKYKRVDVLVNNAGIGAYTLFEERTVEDFKKVTDVNLLGTFLCSQVFCEQMKKQKSGVIINLGSIYGMTSPDYRIYGDSGRNNPEVYGATKAGVINMTKYLAAYLARYGIRVNSISPGGLFNNQKEFFVKNYEYKTPMGRMANETDLMGAAVFLASDASKYITGQNIAVDGGFTVIS